MPFTNFPNGISSFGIPLLGGGVPPGSGNVFWVDSNGGFAAGANGDVDNPFPSLAAALADSRVKADHDDTIIIKARHAENISAAATIALSKAGIRVIGLGRGQQRPTFTFTTATTATMAISAASVLLHNLRFAYTSFDAIATGINVTAGDAEISNCDFLLGDSGEQATIAVTLGTGANRAFIHHCVFSAPNAGPEAAIKSAVALGDVRIEDNNFVGDYSVACISNITNAWARCWLMRNVYFGANASEPIIELVTGATGIIAYNLTFCATFSAAGSIVADAAGKFENYVTDTAANSGILDPTGVTL